MAAQPNHYRHCSIWSHFSVPLMSDFNVQQKNGGFVEHLSQTYTVRQSVTQFIEMIDIYLIMAKVGAKLEILFYKLDSGLLNISVRHKNHDKV